MSCLESLVVQLTKKEKRGKTTQPEMVLWEARRVLVGTYLLERTDSLVTNLSSCFSVLFAD